MRVPSLTTKSRAAPRPRKSAHRMRWCAQLAPRPDAERSASGAADRSSRPLAPSRMRTTTSAIESGAAARRGSRAVSTNKVITSARPSPSMSCTATGPGRHGCMPPPPLCHSTLPAAVKAPMKQGFMPPSSCATSTERYTRKSTVPEPVRSPTRTSPA